MCTTVAALETNSTADIKACLVGEWCYNTALVNNIFMQTETSKGTESRNPTIASHPLFSEAGVYS